MILHSVGRAVGAVALAGVVVIASIEWLLGILRPEGGPLGVLQVLAPHLALAGLALVPLGLLARRGAAVVAAIALIAIVGFRFGGEWVSLPPPSPAPDTIQLSVASWNLEVQSRPGHEAVAMLRAQEADLVALQELEPEVATAIDSDPVLRDRYPDRALAPRGDVLGMGLLSSFPIRGASVTQNPAIQQATIELDDGRLLAVVNAHPFHADIATTGGGRIPVGLDVAQRNADLVAIRRRIDGRPSADHPLVLLGDLNTASSEPAFDRFVAGLRDVHAEVGEGTGWTWRPIRFEFLGLGLVRIDHIVVTPAITPLGAGVACPPVGDHCLVRAVLGIGPGQPGASGG